MDNLMFLKIPKLLVVALLAIWPTIHTCPPQPGGGIGGFISSQDPAHVNARCSDLILYPVNAVDQSDQYRFDYSDVAFGNTHAQGATVAITCTANGQPATVEGFDQSRSSIQSSPSLLAMCTNVGGSQYTWTVLGRILQFVDCRY
ncbi:unnamed protein product [Bursaphelenchus xylophilus]|uniref:(pine wood nematode) hypothetical protein n=1 Tax=Bursaphelenchus xylophilus TaxID=6326 RepID=A0A1I7RUJ7_BURXY|nr:unnamed protein product [Bursaphelenchus xylophilus]CAG9114173.1 unnamed protein product [Bursaphelenchus xylophilus]